MTACAGAVLANPAHGWRRSGTYGHFWPDPDDRTRAAVDASLAPAADSLPTESVSSQVEGV
jgi:hypothetical protein